MTANTASLSIQSIVGAVRKQGDTLDLVIYWRSIAKRKFMILAAGLGLGAAAAVAVSVMTPIYRSTVTLLIEQNSAKVAPTEEVYGGVGDSREHFQTQAEILKSRALAVKVVEKLRLAQHPDFDPRKRELSLIDRLKDQLGLSATAPQLTEEQLQKAAVGAVMARMTVEPVRLSQLIKVHFDSADAATAAEIANAIADTYIESDMEARDEMNLRASDWLGGRLEGLKKNLQDSERALQNYREQAQ